MRFGAVPGNLIQAAVPIIRKAGRLVLANRTTQETNKWGKKKVGLGITKKGKKRFSAVAENLNEKAILIIYKAGQFISAKRTTQ